MDTFQARKFLSRNDSLPISESSNNNQQPQRGGLRRRLSSLSLNMSPISFRRSKSVSAMGDYAGSSVKKWWERGWSWILSKKQQVVGKDLELHEDEETRWFVGRQTRGNLRHLFYKVRSEFRKLVSKRVGLPQTCRYNSYDYSKNFDDGGIVR